MDQPKQFHLLAGKPILIHTVLTFLSNSHIDQVVVVVPRDWLVRTENLFERYSLTGTKLLLVAGGRRRQDSVRAGLEAVASEMKIVLVHDGARPLVSHEIIDECYNTALRTGAAIAAVPVKDTLKKAGEDRKISSTIDRSGLWQAQTPQAIMKHLLERAYNYNDACGDIDVTDESSLLEKSSIPVSLVEGAESNFKITRPEDLLVAETILQKKSKEQDTAQQPFPQATMRIGHGYDAHRFADNRKLVLGGITVPHSQGLAGHSDADVLTHALCDALLGGLGLGDIGKHFPDSDQRYAGVYSITLLEHVVSLAGEQGYCLCNADITLVCQAPRLAPYLAEMKELLSRTCKTQLGCLNIKATTTEKMGFTGRQEGISCHAVVLLQAVP